MFADTNESGYVWTGHGYQFSSIYVIVFKSLRFQRVHTYPDSLRFQKFPLWRPFSKVCGYRMRFRRIRVDAKRNRDKMLADTNEFGYVWTGPMTLCRYGLRAL